MTAVTDANATCYATVSQRKQWTRELCPARSRGVTATKVTRWHPALRLKPNQRAETRGEFSPVRGGQPRCWRRTSHRDSQTQISDPRFLLQNEGNPQVPSAP